MNAKGKRRWGRVAFGVWNQQMQTITYREDNSKILLYSSWNCIQNPIINHSGKGYENSVYLTSLLGCQMDILNLYEYTQTYAPWLSSTNVFFRHHFRRWQLKFLVTQDRSPGVIFDFYISLNTTYIFFFF